VVAFRRDLDRPVATVCDPSTELYAETPSNPEHTGLREAPIVMDHNPYHTGEFGVLRQTADAWGPSRTP